MCENIDLCQVMTSLHIFQYKKENNTWSYSVEVGDPKPTSFPKS